MQASQGPLMNRRLEFEHLAVFSKSSNKHFSLTAEVDWRALGLAAGGDNTKDYSNKGLWNNKRSLV